MSIENSFDDKSEALITPEKFYGNHERTADIGALRSGSSNAVSISSKIPAR